MSAITGKCIVELEKGVYIAPWKGDPGRTLNRETAKVFKDWREGQKHLEFARHFRPFRKARVIPIEQSLAPAQEECE